MTDTTDEDGREHIATLPTDRYVIETCPSGDHFWIFDTRPGDPLSARD